MGTNLNKTFIKLDIEQGIISIIVAVLFIAFGTFQYCHYSHLKNVCTDRTVGTVESLNYSMSSNSSKHRRYYVGTVSYTVNGRYAKVKTSKVRKHTLKKGDILTVMYNPSKYKESYVKEHEPSDGTAALVVGAGIAIYGGIFVAKGLIKKKREESYY